MDIRLMCVDPGRCVVNVEGNILLVTVQIQSITVTIVLK